MPDLDPGKTVARKSASELTAAEFRRLYWKTDTPVIVIGLFVAADGATPHCCMWQILTG